MGKTYRRDSDRIKFNDFKKSKTKPNRLKKLNKTEKKPKLKPELEDPELEN